MSKPKPEEHISDRLRAWVIKVVENTVHYTSVNMAQLSPTTAFIAGAQFAWRNALYAARNEYHKKSGYKLAVKNSNKEQVISVCHQHKAVEPKKKCPLQIRANSGKRSELVLDDISLRWAFSLVQCSSEFEIVGTVVLHCCTMRRGCTWQSHRCRGVFIHPQTGFLEM